jgi:hypothetical protein
MSRDAFPQYGLMEAYLAQLAAEPFTPPVEAPLVDLPPANPGWSPW